MVIIHSYTGLEKHEPVVVLFIVAWWYLDCLPQGWTARKCTVAMCSKMAAVPAGV